jgi:hypothetical protein
MYLPRYCHRQACFCGWAPWWWRRGRHSPLEPVAVCKIRMCCLCVHPACSLGFLCWKHGRRSQLEPMWCVCKLICTDVWCVCCITWLPVGLEREQRDFASAWMRCVCIHLTSCVCGQLCTL